MLTTGDGADDALPVRDAMLAAIPRLRAFAISLSGNVDRADDLVQETLVRAMASIDSFQPGTNMTAWLFTIPNCFTPSIGPPCAGSTELIT